MQSVTKTNPSFHINNGFLTAPKLVHPRFYAKSVPKESARLSLSPSSATSPRSHFSHISSNFRFDSGLSYWDSEEDFEERFSLMFTNFILDGSPLDISPFLNYSLYHENGISVFKSVLRRLSHYKIRKSSAHWKRVVLVKNALLDILIVYDLLSLSSVQMAASLMHRCIQINDILSLNSPRSTFNFIIDAFKRLSRSFESGRFGLLQAQVFLNNYIASFGASEAVRVVILTKAAVEQVKSRAKEFWRGLKNVLSKYPSVSYILEGHVSYNRNKSLVIKSSSGSVRSESSALVIFYSGEFSNITKFLKNYWEDFNTRCHEIKQFYCSLIPFVALVSTLYRLSFTSVGQGQKIVLAFASIIRAVDLVDKNLNSSVLQNILVDD